MEQERFRTLFDKCVDLREGTIYIRREREIGDCKLSKIEILIRN